MKSAVAITLYVGSSADLFPPGRIVLNNGGGELPYMVISNAGPDVICIRQHWWTKLFWRLGLI